MRSRDRIATRTDLFVQPRDTRSLHRDGYLVVRTESMPSYQMGNYLILDQPPAVADIDAWLGRCWQELGDQPIQKRLLVWETEWGEVWPAPGQTPPREYELLVVLRRDEPPAAPAAPPEDIVFRPLSGDRDWQLVPGLAVATLVKQIPGYAGFIKWRYDQFRRSLDEGRGLQWGAWRGDALVATMGLFSAPEALRFQEVHTHPEHRRRGICTALCTHALRHHMAAEPGKPAIIVAEAGAQAERIYRRIGFVEVGRQHVLSYPVPAGA